MGRVALCTAKPHLDPGLVEEERAPECSGEGPDGCIPPPLQNTMFYFIVTLLPGTLFRGPSQATLYLLMPLTLQASLPLGRSLPLCTSYTLPGYPLLPHPSVHSWVLSMASHLSTPYVTLNPEGTRTNPFLLVLVSPVPSS